MRARVNFAVDAFAVVVYVFATNPATTGTPVHEWMGIGLALAAFVHLALHWDWASRVTTRFFRRLGLASRLNFIVDAVLLVAFVTVILSGLLVSRSALKPLGLTVSDNSVWHAVHSQSATVLLALIGVHLGLHWSWIASAFRHRIFRPILNPVGTFNDLRVRALTALSKPGSSPKPALRAGASRTLATLALVLVTAGAVYGVASESHGRLLAPWLTMPGGSGAGLAEQARAASAGTAPVARLAQAGDSANIDRAGTPAMREVVRSAHAFLVLGLAMMFAMAFGGLLRPN